MTKNVNQDTKTHNGSPRASYDSWNRSGVFQVYSDINYPPIPSTEIDASLQRYVDGTNGSDSNDGQLVSNGGTGPWLTMDKALQELCASSTWKWLNLRNTITVSSLIWTKTYGSGPGASGDPAIIRKDPLFPATLELNAGINPDGQQHWLWYGFNITGTHGINVSQDLNTNYHTFRNINGIMSGLGGDNRGIIKAVNGNADYFGVFNCDLTGPGLVGDGVHGNTACIIWFETPHFRVENNEVKTAPRPLYFKHANNAANDPSDWYIRNNFINETGSSPIISGRGGEISNNIFRAGLAINNGGGGEAPHSINIYHNTILNNLGIADGDGVTEINGMDSRNNIIGDDYIIDQYGTSGYTNTCTSDYNLIADSVFFQGTTYATLSSWQAASVPANQDTNSIQDSATYTGGDPTTTGYYLLTQGSAGKGVASDTFDIGADISKVGVQP